MRLRIEPAGTAWRVWEKGVAASGDSVKEPGIRKRNEVEDRNGLATTGEQRRIYTRVLPMGGEITRSCLPGKCIPG